MVVKRAAAGDEEAWIVRAMTGTVERLRAQVGGEALTEVGGWHRILLALTAEQARVVGAALEVAGLVSDDGPVTPLHERLRFIGMEYLGSFGRPAPRSWPQDSMQPAGADEGAIGAALAEGAAGIRELLGSGAAAGLGAAQPAPAPPPAAGSLPGPEAALLVQIEADTDGWEELTRLVPVPAEGWALPDAEALDEELRRLARMRAGWDELLGRLCRLARLAGVWRAAGFLSWSHYCAVRIGASERTVRKRVALAAKLEHMTELREALRSGRITYEHARQISFEKDPARVQERIELAASATAAELRRVMGEEEERKISGGGVQVLRVPEEVDEVLQDAFAAVREREGRWVPLGACLAAVAQHFLETWQEVARARGEVIG